MRTVLIAGARRFVSDSAFTLGIHLSTIAAAGYAYPILERSLGPAGLGAFLLVWLVIGYFGILDGGLGRALTFEIARLKRGDANSIPNTVSTILVSVTAIGFAVAATLFFASNYFSAYWAQRIGIPANDYSVSLAAVSLTLPFVLASNITRGALEGFGDFKRIGLAYTPLGVASFLVPALVASQSRSISYTIVSLCFIRLLALPAVMLVYRQTYGNVLKGNFDLAILKRMFRYGAWVSVSGIIGPLLTSIDRFLIGTKLGLHALGIYGPVFELGTKPNIVAGSVASVLFQRFAGVSEAQTEVKIVRALLLASVGVGIAQVCIFTPILFWAREIVFLWLGGNEIDTRVALVQIIVFGTFANGLAFVPFAYIQACGRADITAKLHMLEACAYVPVLAVVGTSFGLLGIAVAWSVRCIVDALLLYICALRVRRV